MKAKRIGLVLIIASVVLMLATYAAHKRYRTAYRQTISFVNPDYVESEIRRTGKVPADAKVTIQMIGAERRAADRAGAIRTVFVIASLAAVASGILCIIGGMLGQNRKSNDTPKPNGAGDAPQPQR